MAAQQHLSIPRAIILLLGIYAYFALYGFAFKNRFVHQIFSLIGRRVFPGEAASWPRGITGITPLDYVFGGLVSFFWPILDGSTPYLSLANVPFAGQFVATCTMAMIDDLRYGNQGRSVPTALVYGTVIQSMGFATVVPFYLLIHLTNSGTIVNPSPRDIAIDDESTLRSIPFAVSLAYIFTTAFISLPAPSIISYKLKMYSILLWLFFPAFCRLALDGSRAALEAIIPTTSRQLSAEEQAASRLRILRRVYLFAITIGALSQIFTLSISSAAYLFPGLFAPEQAAALTPSNIFLPTSPFRSDVQVSSVAEGVHLFMQWDYLIACVAYVVWGVTIRYSMDISEDKPSLVAVLGTLTPWDWSDILLRPLVLGPIAAAMSWVWERDEIVFGRVPTSKSKGKNN